MIFNQVRKNLLTANRLTQDDLSLLLERVVSHGADYSDLYFQSMYSEMWVLEDRLIKNASYHYDQGVGVRAVSDDKTGFAYSGQIDLPTLSECALAARRIDRRDAVNSTKQFARISPLALYGQANPLLHFSKEDKIALLHEVDTLARSLDKRVTEVRTTLMGGYDEILIAATDGTLAADIRPLVRLSITVLVEEKGKRESGSCGGGGRFEYKTFLTRERGSKETPLQMYTRNAVRQALINLSAESAPAGEMPVVLGAGWPAVLLHEAVGHGLEGDFNRKGSSVFTQKLGQLVTSPLCTIVDDSTLPGRRGSLTIDDEGIAGQSTLLIENGVLKNYMLDKLNARLLGLTPTGNGRRESYAYLPMPRMTNTYMLPGESTFDDIISSVEYGLYAPNFSGGQVDITSGKFVFSTSEAYLIEKGKITMPVKGATLIGSGIETMQGVSMVGNDLDLDKGVGICGKDGQNVPVGVGQPTIKVDKLTVGGTVNH